MKRFFGCERGYVLILTLIFLPVFIGIGLLVIDVGRGINAQQDHQAAADALALAGARQLDGRADSVIRAKAAMEAIENTVSFVSVRPAESTRTLIYTSGTTAPFNVIFLKAIPDSDDTPITAQFAKDNVATGGLDARYVYVYSRTDNLNSLFFNPLSRQTEVFSVGAEAVATLNRSTCDLAPIFMCNPFVGNAAMSSKDKLLAAFRNGDLHGRMVKLSSSPASSMPGPGNIGFLRTSGKRGAYQLAGALAGDPYPECVTLQPTVDTQPGAVASAAFGFNTRFDIFSNAFGGDFAKGGDFTPAANVRKGWYNNAQSGGCIANGAIGPGDTKYQPPLAPMFSDNRDPATDLGAFANVMRQGPWNFAQSIPNVKDASLPAYSAYWPTLYPKARFPNIGFDTTADANYAKMKAAISSKPGAEPSRFDVYQYELTHDANGDPVTDPNLSLAATASAAKETGRPQCYANASPPAWRTDRRTMFVAVVDCVTNQTNGNKTVPVDLLAKIFLVNPLKGPGGDPGSDTVDFEFVDVSEGSNGGLEAYIREDAVLVR